MHSQSAIINDALDVLFNVGLILSFLRYEFEKDTDICGEIGAFLMDLT